MSNKIKNLSAWMHQGNISTWILFVSFTFLLFVKCILFHWDAFHCILISSLWKAPLAFYKFYMAKLLMPLFIASFIFISKKYWWTIIVSLLTDIWCVSNLIYLKTYDEFLTVNDILLIENMDGAWSSVTAYFDWIMLVMLLLSVVWAYFIISMPRKTQKRHWGKLIITILVVNALAHLNNYFMYNPKFWDDNKDPYVIQMQVEENEQWVKFINDHGGYEQINEDKLLYIPFYSIYRDAKDITTVTANFMEHYVRQQSILSDFVAVNIYYAFCKDIQGEIISLSKTDLSLIEPLISQDTLPCIPQSNLIVILVESLEDWPLQHDIEGVNVAPYLRSLINKDHVLYCSKITSQALGGNSGDGQMIINSGLLPSQNLVACTCYGSNFYPNLAHFYKDNMLVNPWPKIWNQDTMSVRYGFLQKTEPKSSQWEDAEVFDHSKDYLQQVQQLSCLLTITISTHSPFNRVRNTKIQTNAPALLNRYMKCINYTDSCICDFMNMVLTDPDLSQSTIVITGDHTIFKSAMLVDFKDYADTHNLSIKSGENYCPLIIYSPEIKRNIHIHDVCYQMDIFPTILHLIGCDNYFWHGLGVNLLDENSRHNRSLTESEAFYLSDLIIRSDYFRQYLHKK